MQPTDIARRYFFGQCGYGLGKLALAGLLTGAMVVRRLGMKAHRIPWPRAHRISLPKQNV